MNIRADLDTVLIPAELHLESFLLANPRSPSSFTSDAPFFLAFHLFLGFSLGWHVEVCIPLRPSTLSLQYSLLVNEIAGQPYNTEDKRGSVMSSILLSNHGLSVLPCLSDDGDLALVQWYHLCYTTRKCCEGHGPEINSSCLPTHPLRRAWAHLNMKLGWKL